MTGASQGASDMTGGITGGVPITNLHAFRGGSVSVELCQSHFLTIL